jgi:hypothetical protein
MVRKISKRHIILLVIVCVLIVGFAAISQTFIGKALFKSTKHFIPLDSDSRVLYEPGSEENAMKISSLLDQAIEKVETEHNLPFLHPFKVYVCNTQRSINEYVGQRGDIGPSGTAVRSDVFLAPKAFNFAGNDESKGVLIHEASHLHIKQRVGYWGVIRDIPVWFHDGLAVIVSNESTIYITDKDAIDSINSGIHFTPDEKGTSFRLKRANDYGMNLKMFYKQSGIFVRFIKSNYPDEFKEFLVDIQEGKNFADSFEQRFNLTITEMWDRFERECGHP